MGKKKTDYTFARKDDTYTRAQKSATLSLFSKQSEELFRFFIVFRFGGALTIFPRLGVSFRPLYFLPSLLLYSPYLLWLYLRAKSTQGFDFDGDVFVVVVSAAAAAILSLSLLLLNSGRDQRGGSGERRRRRRRHRARVRGCLFRAKAIFFVVTKLEKFSPHTRAPLFFSSSREKNSPNYAQT